MLTGRLVWVTITEMSDPFVAYWDAEAQTFDQAVDHGLHDATVRMAWQRLLSGVLPPPPAGVADLGCGTGTLSLLMAEMGHEVDGVDFSNAMLARGRSKCATTRGVSFHIGDVADPPLPPHVFDVVLSRHVLWAMVDPMVALRRWGRLLVPGGNLVLIEGLWQTGAGLAASQVLAMLEELGWSAEVTALDGPELWGREIADERYIIVSSNV